MRLPRLRKRQYIDVCSWVVVIISVVAILHYHRDLPFDRTIEAVIYSPDTIFEKKTTVIVEGEQYRRLNGKHRIAGEITIDQDLSYPFAADLDGNQYEYAIPHWNEDGSRLTLGVIHISKDLGQVWIKSNEVNVRYQLHDGYVYGPASTKRDVGASLSKMLHGE